MIRFSVAMFIALGLMALGGCAVETGEMTGAEDVLEKGQELTGGCSESSAVPLGSVNTQTRLGSNACTMVLRHQLPNWWQYGDGTARVQISNYDSQDPNENAFPLTVEWENTCGTEQGTVVYTNPWEQHELGHASEDCSIVIKLGGEFTEDVLVTWGA